VGSVRWEEETALQARKVEQPGAEQPQLLRLPHDLRERPAQELGVVARGPVHAAQEQLGEREQAGERRAQLVRREGQERVALAHRLLGRLGPFALGDVPRDHQAQAGAVGQGHRRHVGLDRDRAAVLGVQGPLGDGGPAGFPHRGGQPPLPGQAQEVPRGFGPFRPYVLLYFAQGAANGFRYHGHPMENGAYDVAVEGPQGEDVNVVMTLTSPMCPVGPMFKQSVQSKVEGLDGVKNVKVDITFTPPWDPRIMASEDAKFDLGIWF